MNTIFAVLAQSLALTSSRMSFDIQGQGNGQVKVMVQAKLAPVPTTASAETRQLYAAVSAPLVVIGTPEEVEKALLERISQHQAKVSVGISALDQINEIAQKAVAAAAAKPAKPTASVATSTVPPASAHTQDTEGDVDDEEAGSAAPQQQETVPGKKDLTFF